MLVTAAATCWLIAWLVALLKARYSTAISASYPGGIELGGANFARGRTTYRIVQWHTDPADPRPCHLVVHLPGGDLGGEALCDWGATAVAHQLGAPEELEVWPMSKDGKVVGVSIRLIPEGLPGVRPVAVGVAGTRISLPLTDEEAVRLLGEPIQRHTLT
jgi:hypothetical protein